MKKFLIILLALVATASVASADTLTGMNTSTVSPMVSAGETLMLQNVVVQDINTFALQFNRPIDIDTLRIRLTNQNNNETVRVASIEAVAMSPEVATVKTTVSLVSGGAYTVTLIDVTAKDGTKLKTGIDSIRDFIVPASIPGSDLLAPPNPNAVISTGATVVTESPNTATVPVAPPVVQTGMTSPLMTIETPVATGATATGSSNGTAKELPQTGVETTILLFIALTLAGFLLVKRKRA